MDLRFINILQKICWILGFFIIVSAVLNISLQLNGHFFSNSDSSGDRYYIYLSLSRSFFAGLDQAFVLFLVASLIDMIFLNESVNFQATDLFVKLACIGFFGEGILDVIGWAQTVLFTLPQVNILSGRGILDLIGSLIRISSCASSFLFAVIILVLYREFSRQKAK